MMKAKELFKISRSFLFDNLESKRLENYYIDFINDLIAELFKENNDLRIISGKSPLVKIPFVNNAESVIPYEDIMLRSIMPRGLAARFYIDEEDRSKYTILQNDFMNARIQAKTVLFEEYVW